ncbi:MAG: aminotransferase class IV [Arcanobacterium sp.]|nr:aminotransferase class IV [Arcanobacterium sp.]
MSEVLAMLNLDDSPWTPSGTHPAATLVDPASAQLSPRDQGILRGDGIFETIFWDHGQLRQYDLHMTRLERSAMITGIMLPPREQFDAAVQQALDAYDFSKQDGVVPDELQVKIVVTRGYAPENPSGNAWVSVFPVGLQLRAQGPQKVSLLNRGFDSAAAEKYPWLLLGAKTLSYATNMAGAREAARRGSYDALFVTSDDYILEGPTSSFVLAKDHRLVTPRADIGVLPGTTQRALFAEAQKAGWDVEERPVKIEELYGADSAWLTSSARLLVQINATDEASVKADPALHEEMLRLLLSFPE